jgi:transcriptional regulator with XRE-family HTH domain
MTIGHKIKILLAFYNKTNKELANDLGIAAQSISNYIQNLNRPPLEVITKMADLFKVSIDFLANDKYDFHIVYRNDEKHSLADSAAEPAADYEVSKINLEGLTDQQKDLIKQLIKSLREK